MKIVKIETIRLASRPNLIWVRVHTDEGLIGLGESWFGCAAIEADIHDRIAPAIIGADPGRIEALSRAMRPYVGFCGTGAEIRALSAVEVALWDIAGQAAGKPLHALLGGSARDDVPAYNTCAGPDYVSKTSAVRPDNFGLSNGRPKQRRVYEDLTGFMTRPAELAAELLEMGISSMKIWPFDFAAGALDGLAIAAEELKKALSPFEAIRQAHGDRMRIKAELHGLWSLSAAKAICAALEPIEPDWIEDPIWMDRTAEIAELAAFTRAPLAGGETLGGLGPMRDLIAVGRIGTPIVDITWGGGVGFARRVAALAEAFARPVAFHDCSGPVTLTVSTHLAMACPNVVEQEITRAFYYGWYHECLDRLPPLEQGRIRAPEGSGLGVALNPDLLRRDDVLVRTTGPG
jgi:galactonate dehydratase